MTPPRDAIIIRTGAANIASVLAGLARAGIRATLTDEPRAIDDAPLCILPGVGTLGAAMERLTQRGLVEPLRRRLLDGRPTLAICLGLQLLFEGSEESPGVAGLGILPGIVRRFKIGIPTPHFGWNAVVSTTPTATPAATTILRPGMAYYANSYRIDRIPEGWLGATTTHGEPFVAALERGRILACQFHPELSGPWGVDLLRRWAHGDTSTSDLAPTFSPSVAATMSPTGVARRVIPCLDVRDGRVVKGVRFQNLRDSGDPAERAAAYEAQGADELCMLDVSAGPEGRRTAAATVRAVRARLSIPLTVGGGVRTIEDAGLLLDAGADKVAVNSAAVRDPALLTRLADRFGRQCVVLALDAARTTTAARRPRSADDTADPSWEVVVDSGRTRTGLNALAWARDAAERGAGEILLTSWDRDGTGDGYDLPLLAHAAKAAGIPIIASGGAAGPEHLLEALRAGADAVLAASIFHDGTHTVAGVKAFLHAAGQTIRPAPSSTHPTTREPTP